VFDVSPFNPVWWTFIVLLVLACVVLWHVLKDKDEKVRYNVLIAMSLGNLALLFIHKFVLVNLFGHEGFTVFEYFPLELCNLSVLLFPISLIIKKRSLYSFLFFIAPLAAFLALATPSAGFSGESIFLLKNVGYYLTHGVIFIIGISLVTLDIVTIRYKDIPSCFLILFALAALVFFIDSALQATIYPEANYFFTQNPGGSGLLITLWEFWPVKLVYMLPAFVVIIPYEVLLTAIVRRIKKYQPSNDLAIE
jgi:uncharacterized membrane protein YwaF